jgi:hypothetical protein
MKCSLFVVDVAVLVEGLSKFAGVFGAGSLKRWEGGAGV